MSNSCNFRCKHCHQQFSQDAVYQEATVILCPLCSKMFIPSFWHYLRKEWIEPISVAIVLALFIKRIIFEIYVIPTSSMEPTLHGGGHYPEDGGDKVLVNKFVYHFKDPENWDVIVFDPPRGNHLYIKRLIGKPGQTIQIVNGDIYANGKILRKPPKVEDTLLYPIYNSAIEKSVLSHFDDFKKDAWSISENWRLSENHFEITKASGNLKFELPIDLRIESHKPTELQKESGLYEATVKSQIAYYKSKGEYRTEDQVWPQHEDSFFQDKVYEDENGNKKVQANELKVGDIQVSGKINLKEIEGTWQVVIIENEDQFKLTLNIKEKKAEVFKNTEKVWAASVELNKEVWLDFSFDNVDDKVAGKIGSSSFKYEYINEKPELLTTTNGLQFLAINCSLEMKDIVVRRDVNYLKNENPEERIEGHASENKYATWKLGADDYLCFGDNVIDSLDSRSWGFAEGSKIKGQAMFVLMPIRIWFGDKLPPQIPFITHRTRIKKIY